MSAHARAVLARTVLARTVLARTVLARTVLATAIVAILTGSCASDSPPVETVDPPAVGATGTSGPQMPPGLQVAVAAEGDGGYSERVHRYLQNGSALHEVRSCAPADASGQIMLAMTVAGDGVVHAPRPSVTGSLTAEVGRCAAAAAAHWTLPEPPRGSRTLEVALTFNPAGR